MFPLSPFSQCTEQGFGILSNAVMNNLNPNGLDVHNSWKIVTPRRYRIMRSKKGFRDRNAVMETDRVLMSFWFFFFINRDYDHQIAIASCVCHCFVYC